MVPELVERRLCPRLVGRAVELVVEVCLGDSGAGCSFGGVDGAEVVHVGALARNVVHVEVVGIVVGLPGHGRADGCRWRGRGRGHPDGLHALTYAAVEHLAGAAHAVGRGRGLADGQDDARPRFHALHVLAGPDHLGVLALGQPGGLCGRDEGTGGVRRLGRGRLGQRLSGLGSPQIGLVLFLVLFLVLACHLHQHRFFFTLVCGSRSRQTPAFRGARASS